MEIVKNKIIKIYIMLGVFVCNLALAANTQFNWSQIDNSALVEFPEYRKTNKTKDTSVYGVSYTYFKKTIESCEPSQRQYAPMQYIQNYTQFPWVPRTPILEDQLAVFFFKSTQDEKFYNSKWGVVRQKPLIIFHLTQTSRKYRSTVKKVVNHINQRAQHYGLVPGNNKLIEIANRKVDLDQESCAIQMIHFEEEETGGSLAFLLGSVEGVTILQTNYSQSERLGEIRDADIIMYPGNIRRSMQFNTDYLKMDERQQERVISNELYRTLMHEMMHALGVDHNFSLGTVVDYNELVFGESFDESLAYEMEVLNFLYNGKPKTKDWPLIRTEKTEHTYEPEEKHFFVSEQWYDATVIGNSLDFICVDNEGMQKTHAQDVAKDFQLKLTYEDNDSAFIDYALFGFEIKGLISEKVFSIRQDLKEDEFGRLIPKLIIDSHISTPEDYADESSCYYITTYEEDTWVYPSPFISAYGLENDTSTMHWDFRVRYPDSKDNLSCKLNADFKISANK